MSDQIDKLLDDTEQHLAAILAAARKQAAANPSKASIEAAQAAEQALRDCRTAAAPAGTPESAPGEWFKNETEAYNYLLSLGYDISRGKFNQDKNSGQLTVDGKKVSKFSVLQYGLRLKQAQKATASIYSGDLQARRELADTEKAEHDARIARMKADEAERELQRRWLYRDEAVADLAAIIASLQQALDHAVIAGAEAIIRCAGGDVTRTFDVSEAVNELVIGRAFNEVAAAGSLRVKFKGERQTDAD